MAATMPCTPDNQILFAPLDAPSDAPEQVHAVACKDCVFTMRAPQGERECLGSPNQAARSAIFLPDLPSTTPQTSPISVAAASSQGLLLGQIPLPKARLQVRKKRRTGDGSSSLMVICDDEQGPFDNVVVIAAVACDLPFIPSMDELGEKNTSSSSADSASFATAYRLHPRRRVLQRRPARATDPELPRLF